jgi:hypothetical protein
MATDYSVGELLEFLNHAADRGLMPAATARALAVACRNVFGILNSEEGADLRRVDLPNVIKRFTNKRAKEFNPSSLKEYARRAQRAVELFVKWRADPASFSVKTRTTRTPARKKERTESAEKLAPLEREHDGNASPALVGSFAYQSSFPIRPGTVVTISNIPIDLSKVEADRLAAFIKMLAV